MFTSKIISADSHVLEPPELWVSRISKEFRDKAPRFVVNHNGEQGTFLVAEGIAPKRIASIAAVNMKQEDLPSFNNAGHADFRPGGWDPAERLKDQDEDGVLAEVVYATYAMYLFAITDARFLEACFKAYNDWLAEFCGHAPKRIVGLGLISIYNVDWAVGELQRCAKLGLKGAMIPCVPPDGTELSDAVYDPFWSAAEDLGLPISLHILTSNRANLATPRFGYGDFGAGVYVATPHELQLSLADLICRGVLERHPKLRLVSAEADTGWLAHFLVRLDRGQKRYAHLNNLPLKMTPSEYFKKQVYATFINDPIGVATREFVGAENLMWSSDYPHTDSSWPHSRDVIAKDFQGVPDEDREKMTFGNVVNLYGLDVA